MTLQVSGISHIYMYVTDLIFFVKYLFHWQVYTKNVFI